MQSSPVQVPCISGSPHGVFGCTQVLPEEADWGACASAGWAASAKMKAAFVIPKNAYLIRNLLLQIPNPTSSVADLRRDVLGFVHLAVTALGEKSRIGILVTLHHARRQHPRLHQYSRVLNRDVVQQYITLTPEFLDDMHQLGVEQAAAPQPRRIDERNGVDYQRIAFPTSHRIPHIRRLNRLFRVVLAVV